MKNRFVWLAALGHLFTDLNQGAVPALLPFFIAEYHLSYASAAGLVAALSIASTVIQPLFGFYADRLSKPWLIPAGVGMAGCGVAFCTLLPDYGFAVAMIVLSGIGIAAFHPEGARLVHNHAGEKKATAMSICAVGVRNISEIHGDDLFGLSLLAEGLCLKLGFGDYDAKLRRMKPVLADLARRKLSGYSIIDLNNPGKVTVQLRDFRVPVKVSGGVRA